MGLCASVPGPDDHADGTVEGKKPASSKSPPPVALSDVHSNEVSSARPGSVSLHEIAESKALAPPASHAEEALIYLSNIPLLAKLSPNEKKQLVAVLQERVIPDGATMVQEGEDGAEFFIIMDGRARVTQEGAELCYLARGDYFGETALVNNSKRGATIVAAGPVTALVLTREKFQRVCGEERFNVAYAKRVAVSAEAYNPEEKDNDAFIMPEGAVTAKDDETKSMVMKAVSSNILFQGLDPSQQGQIVDTMWLREVAAGESIIKQGEMGDNFYVVQSGHFEIFVRSKDGTVIKVATRDRGQTFGELALMYNAPRAATVTATAASTVWAVSRATFRRVLTSVTHQKLRAYEQFLRNVSDFECLQQNDRSKVAEALEEVSFPAGHDIMSQGADGDTFYILKKGEAVAKINANGAVAEVKRYGPGDYFGERALVKNEPRAATVTTLTECECLSLNRQAFSMLLGPMEDIFQKQFDAYNSVNPDLTRSTTLRQSMSGPPSPSMQPQHLLRTDIDLKELRLVGTLGKGSFGHVQLMTDKQGAATYALKTVSKAQIVNLGQQEHIMSEKRVMAQLNHPFLIRLHATFKDRNCLYFLLEPSLGGELFSVLRAKTYFDEPTARFFAAGVVLAFEYMHSKGIIYRDLKPENLLLDSRGYLKITDFGFAKRVGDQRTWTLCGTPDYLAPEVVSGQGHGKGVDWWTLGILIYEMLASYPPFYDEDPMKTYAKIMHGQIAFPTHFSKNAVDLIRRLLHSKATKRLGVLKGGARLVKEHPWFKGFDWDAFEQQRMAAPIVLPVKNNTDLSNFEEYPDEDMAFEDYVPPANNPDWDKDF